MYLIFHLTMEKVKRCKEHFSNSHLVRTIVNLFHYFVLESLFIPSSMTKNGAIWEMERMCFVTTSLLLLQYWATKPLLHAFKYLLLFLPFNVKTRHLCMATVRGHWIAMWQLLNSRDGSTILYRIGHAKKAKVWNNVGYVLSRFSGRDYISTKGKERQLKRLYILS